MGGCMLNYCKISSLILILITFLYADHIWGKITVYYKNGKTIELDSTHYVLMVKDSIDISPGGTTFPQKPIYAGVKYKAGIKKRGRNVKPRKTDSIIVKTHKNTYVGYPDTEYNCWMWIVSQGKVPLYAASPQTPEWNLKYKLSYQKEFQDLPLYLSYSESKTDGGDTPQIDSSILGLMGTQPLLFVEYRYDPEGIIRRFNTLETVPPFDLRTDKEKIFNYIYVYFSLPTNTINFDALGFILTFDTTSQIALVGSLMRCIQNLEFDNAKNKLTEIEEAYEANKITNSLYLVEYARGQYYASIEDYSSAMIAFEKLSKAKATPYKTFGVDMLNKMTKLSMINK